MASKYLIFETYKESVAFLTSNEKGGFLIFDAKFIEFVPIFVSVTFPTPTVNDR